jgi:hypothetical protein
MPGRLHRQAALLPGTAKDRIVECGIDLDTDTSWYTHNTLHSAEQFLEHNGEKMNNIFVGMVSDTDSNLVSTGSPFFYNIRYYS